VQGTFKLQFNCSGFDFCGFFSQIKCDRLLHENIEGRTRGKPTKGRRRIQMLHDLADGYGLLHSNGQQRTEKDGDTEKGCQELAVLQRMVVSVLFCFDNICLFG